MSDKGQLVSSGEHLRATLFNGNSNRLIITFSFRQKGRTEFVEATGSKMFKEQGFAQLAITSRTNDWFINPDTSAIESVLQALAPHYQTVQMLGYSMGGYGAFRFAAAANASNIVAVSPQFSIHPDVIPFDKRFRSDAGGFDLDVGDLTAVAHPDLQGIILADPFRPLDLVNAQMIQEVFPRVKLARLGFGGHPATGLLARSGKAGVVQRAALQSPPDPASVIQAHRAARAEDETYAKDVVARILKR